MNTDRLRAYCLIVEVGSLTKAAELLHSSHSALSKSMAALQAELGLELFRPQGRGLEVTEAGRSLYARAQDVLAAMSRLKAGTEEAPRKKLRLGTTEVFAIAFSTEFAQSLDLALDLYVLDAGEMEAKVLAQELDFAIGTVPFPHPHLEFLKIARTTMGVYVTNKKLLHVELKALRFVGPNSEIKNNSLSIRSRDGWPESQERDLFYGASNLATALSVADSGRAATFIPHFLAKNLNEKRSSEFQLHEYKFEKIIAASRDIFLIKKKSREETREMKTVAKIIRKACH